MNILKRQGGNFPALILLLTGFLAGNLIPNFLWRAEWEQDTLAAVYLLGELADREIDRILYFAEILRVRGGYWFMIFLSGFSVFGVPAAVIGMLLQGANLGVLISFSVLEFGFQGGLIGAALLFPQYIFYIPAWIFLMCLVYGQSMEIWKNRGMLPQKIGTYMMGGGIFILLMIPGIFLECFANPWIVKKILEITDVLQGM